MQLEPVTMNLSKIKVGIYGDTGSGKTTTAALMMIGLYHYLLSQKKLKQGTPVAMFDTENSAGWIQPLFEMANVPFVRPTNDISIDGPRGLFDLLAEFMRETAKENIPIIVDSVTHPWQKLMEGWMADNPGFKSIPMHAWGYLKKRWNGGFAEPFVRSEQHIILCGRSGDIYKDVEDEAPQGAKKKWKPIKVGTKMRTETNLGYEANLLVEMTQGERIKEDFHVLVATVLKDKSRALTGLSEEFRPQIKDGTPDDAALLKANLPFKFIFPHVKLLDLEASQAAGVLKHGTPADPTIQRMRDRAEARKLLFGEMAGLLEVFAPGTSADEKRTRNVLLQACFGTTNRDAIAKTPVADLEHAVLKLRALSQPEVFDDYVLAISQGINAKGKVENPHEAPEAIKGLLERLLEEEATNQGDDGTAATAPAGFRDRPEGTAWGEEEETCPS